LIVLVFIKASVDRQQNAIFLFQPMVFELLSFARHCCILPIVHLNCLFNIHETLNNMAYCGELDVLGKGILI
jgi:hypothetical protein